MSGPEDREGAPEADASRPARRLDRGHRCGTGHPVRDGLRRAGRPARGGRSVRPAAADSRIQEALRGAPTKTTALVLDAEAMTHVDSAGLQALEDLAGTLESDGIALHIARAKHPMGDRLAERLDGARFHGTVRAAVSSAMRRDAAAGA